MPSAADFGRFGFGPTPKIPGWDFSFEGIKAAFASSDRLVFETPIQAAQPREVQAHEASFALVGGGQAPTRLRVNLFAPGPEFLFERGFKLKCRSLSAPLLSWAEGSVAEGVETPKGRWVAISFQDSQPPILLTMLDEPASIIVTGRAGDWTIATVSPYRKWIRLALPVGVRAWTTTDAAALGAMVKQIRSNGMFWTGPSPVLQRIEAVNGPGYVDGIWTFSGPNAVVPFAAFLARRGGYGVQIQSKIKEIAAPSDEGPVAYVPEKTLRLRFPMLTVPAGRSLVSGPATISSSVPDGAHYALFERAMQSLMAPRPDELELSLAKTFEQYLANSELVKIPNTQSRLSFHPNGQGATEAGFMALVEQALSTNVHRKPGGVLSTLTWARDSLSWELPMIEDPSIRRRTWALASISAGLSTDPRTRLDGAMMHAGLCAERGHAAWMGGEKVQTFLEPMDEFRHRLYRAPELPKREPLLPLLVNPVRVLDGPPIVATNVAQGYHLQFSAPRPGQYSIVLQSPQVLKFFSTAHARVTAMKSPEGRYDLAVGVRSPGKISFGVKVVGAKPITLPKYVPIGYTEKVR
ncbi:MAG: hypothetical protein JNK63_06855 [Chthonomonas sp.]|nr:hypothetical protein [Chthonomonas sp.]